MCGLVILCFVVKINPDNVATPIAASLGDLMMLVVLAMVSTALWFTRGTAHLRFPACASSPPLAAHGRTARVVELVQTRT